MIGPNDIDLLELEFEATGNPLFALRAWHVARASNTKVPDWVLSYLDASIENIFAIDEPPKKDIGQIVANSFNFPIGKGKRSAFSEYVHRIRIINVWAAVQSRHEHTHDDGRRDKRYVIFEEVATEMEVSISSVERWYNEFNDFLKSNE